MILTSTGDSLRWPNLWVTKSNRGTRHESSAATRCSSRDPPPRLRGHDRLPAWRRAVGRAEGDLAPSHAGLGLDIPDGDGGGQFVLDPPDPADRSMEPDPSAVDLHAGRASNRGMDGAPSPRRRSPPHHDPDFLRCARHRRTIHLRPGADHAHVAVRPIATRQELSRPAIWASEAALENSFQEQGSPAAAKAAADPVSLWKNEGKNRWRQPLKGGLGALDTLYDSHLKLTGFPLCLTLKIPSPESRRGPRIFVPYPSSTR